MSPKSSSRSSAGGAVRKQELNIYTVMLIVSFAALFTACILLWLELRQYGSGRWWDTSGARPAPTSQLQAPLTPFAQHGALA